MNKICLTRHAGVAELVARYLGRADVRGQEIVLYDLNGEVHDTIAVVSHLDADEARRLARKSGLVLYGVVPLHLAALAQLVFAVEWDCAPPRGREMSAEWVRRHGRLVPYVVRPAATCDVCGSVDVESVAEGVQCRACGAYYD